MKFKTKKIFADYTIINNYKELKKEEGIVCTMSLI